MKPKLKRITILIFIILSIIVSLKAQYREYYVKGKIVDINKNPIEGAEIIIINETDNMRLKFKTDKRGDYKIAGIMHGIYRVIINKEGYKSQKTKWNLSAPQQRMKKVKIEPITLISEEKFKEIKLNKELKKKYEHSKKLITEGKYKEAGKNLQEILNIKPDEINTNYLLGICYDKSGDFSKAKGFYEKVIKLNPDFAPANFKLAVLYQKENNTEKSIYFYKKTIESDNRNWVAYYNLGILMFQGDKTDDAIKYFKKVLNINPADGSTLEYLGLCYLKKGEKRKAISYLRKAKEFFKNNKDKIKTIDKILKKIEK